jgi:putative acetyltransferase
MTPRPEIRAERPADTGPIFRITEAAFRGHPHSQGTEPFIVDALREAGALTLSLVAERDGEVCGHIAVSPAGISDGAKGWYALGPVSVAPEWQRQGIGSALVRAALDALRRLGAEGCVLVGEPGFYGRFGFASRPALSMEGVPQAFVLSLPFGTTAAAGDIVHHDAFNARRS